MSHWINSSSQVIGVGSGMATIVDLDIAVIQGNQTIQTGGIHTYSYVLNLTKPSGEIGPTLVVGTLGVQPSGEALEIKFATISRTEIDTGSKEMFGHTGEIPLAQNDTIKLIVWAEQGFPDVLIATSTRTCSLALRRVLGQGT